MNNDTETAAAIIMMRTAEQFHAIAVEASLRIEKLEAALREIASLDDVRADEAAGIARRALER